MREMWTADKASAELKKWETEYSGTPPKGGWMICSLCILLVGISISILKHLEGQSTSASAETNKADGEG